MCDQCKPNKKHWVHIADNWTDEEKREMLDYIMKGWKYVV